MKMEYWRFYWPLALTASIMVLGGQFQNGVLARYPEAVTELAVFAIAGSTFGLLHAGIGFVSQISNVYARSAQGWARTLLFVVLVSAVFTLLLLVLAFTPLGALVLRAVYGINEALTERVVLYLKLFCPLLLLDGLRQFQLGLLIQNRMTGRVTLLNMLQLGTMITSLVMGFAAGLPAPYVLVGSQILASLVHLLAMSWVINRDYRLPAEPEHEQLLLGELFRFFLPVATTGVMFAISRPVLYALIARSPDAIVSIAALRVGFDVATLFQMTANQFRHFFVTFGDDNLAQKRLFMLFVGAGITGAMLLVAATPLSHFLLQTLIGISGRVLEYAKEVLLMMCALPGLILWRNYYHGLLMVARRTNGMALGGIVRVGGIYVLGNLMHFAGWLNYRTATLILLLGFVLEALVVMFFYLRLRRAGIARPG
ncbi:MAG: hypothetical protein ACFHX7_04730 [Pseudomonadota bacterium]